MMRELSSVFVAGYSVLLLVLLLKHNQGGEVFEKFWRALAHPVSFALQLMALVFVVYHSWTSFKAAPVIIVLWNGDEKVSPSLIAGAHFALWVILTFMILLSVLE